MNKDKGNEKKANGKVRPIVIKGQAPTVAVIVQSGGRTYMGFTPLSIDEFDRRADRGGHVVLFNALELCHVSQVDGERMTNLVSMTSIDHLYGPANKHRVRADSWYFLTEQDQLSQGVYRGLYAQTMQGQAARAKALAEDIAAHRKADAEAAEKAKGEAESSDEVPTGEDKKEATEGVVQ